MHKRERQCCDIDNPFFHNIRQRMFMDKKESFSAYEKAAYYEGGNSSNGQKNCNVEVLLES